MARGTTGEALVKRHLSSDYLYMFMASFHKKLFEYDPSSRPTVEGEKKKSGLIVRLDSMSFEKVKLLRIPAEQVADERRKFAKFDKPGETSRK